MYVEKSIDRETFQNDLKVSDLLDNTCTSDSLDKWVTLYENTMSSILDKHAPLVTKYVSLRPKMPWYNEEIRQVKRKRRKAEKKWMKSGDINDHDIYKSIRNTTLSLMNHARQEYYNDCISENSFDQKKLFQITKSLLNMKKSTLDIPPHIDTETFVNDLGTYFEQKIVKNCDNIQSNLGKIPDTGRLQSHSSCTEVQDKLTQFSSLCENDVQKLVMRLNKKTCSLDPVPTKLVVGNIDILLPVLTKIVNMSLADGCFHPNWKLAVVRPLLKKPGADLQFSNCRPVSNLQYVSKLIEAAVAGQLQQHLLNN